MTTIVISSGTTIVSTGIPATTNYLVENTATLEIANGGSVSATTVDAGGLLDVLAGGIGNDSTISGDLTIYGTVDGLTVNAGGLAVVEAGVWCRAPSRHKEPSTTMMAWTTPAW